MLIVFLLADGCSGTYGDFKRQTESESKVTKRELIDNWSDYDIWAYSGLEYKPDRIRIIVFDTKNDDKKILFRSSWPKVKDQQMWTEIVKENTTSDGEFTLSLENYGSYRFSEVIEIWGPEDQLYGFILYDEDRVYFNGVEQVDENTVRVTWRPPHNYETF